MDYCKHDLCSACCTAEAIDFMYEVDDGLVCLNCLEKHYPEDYKEYEKYGEFDDE